MAAPSTRPGGIRPFRYDRDWLFEVPPADLWELATDTSRWPRWSKWMRELRLTGTSSSASDTRLTTGTRAECRVQGPVPYALRIVVDAQEMVPGQLLVAAVSGDLAGAGRVELSPHPRGTLARVTWEVDLRPRGLRLFALLARPLMEWAHDRVVDDGIDRFRRQLLATEPPRPKAPGPGGGP